MTLGEPSEAVTVVRTTGSRPPKLAPKVDELLVTVLPNDERPETVLDGVMVAEVSLDVEVDRLRDVKEVTAVDWEGTGRPVLETIVLKSTEVEFVVGKDVVSVKSRRSEVDDKEAAPLEAIVPGRDMVELNEIGNGTEPLQS